MVGWVLAALVAVLALGLALVECFLVPLRVGTVPMPVCVPLALAGNVVLPRLSARLSGVPLTAVVPPVLWLGVVLVLSAQRPEGDLVVPGTATALVFLFAGSVAGAYGAASSITRATRPSRPTGG
ncbi:MAG TPA: DUF6113 family protein [Mycobacteriales bacterium]